MIFFVVYVCFKNIRQNTFSRRNQGQIKRKPTREKGYTWVQNRRKGLKKKTNKKSISVCGEGGGLWWFAINGGVKSTHIQFIHSSRVTKYIKFGNETWANKYKHEWEQFLIIILHILKYHLETSVLWWVSFLIFGQKLIRGTGGVVISVTWCSISKNIRLQEDVYSGLNSNRYIIGG